MARKKDECEECGRYRPASTTKPPAPPSFCTLKLPSPKQRCFHFYAADKLILPLHGDK